VDSLSSGFHAVADVAIATATGAIAVLICYPIYIVAKVVTISVKSVHRWDESDGTVEHVPPWCGRKAESRSTQIKGETRVH
jgi:hypothetical protein